jgi:hypothetical protein
MPRWERADRSEFDRLPPRTQQKPPDPEWEELIAELEAGHDVRLPFADEKEMRGLRLSLGRRAARRGFKVELRYGNGFLVARRIEGGVPPGMDGGDDVVVGAGARPRRGRKRDRDDAATLAG